MNGKLKKKKQQTNQVHTKKIKINQPKAQTTSDGLIWFSLFVLKQTGERELWLPRCVVLKGVWTTETWKGMFWKPHQGNVLLEGVDSGNHVYGRNGFSDGRRNHRNWMLSGSDNTWNLEIKKKLENHFWNLAHKVWMQFLSSKNQDGRGK